MKSKLLHIPVLALLFAYLFTNRSLGLNLVFFQFTAIGLIVYHKPEKKWTNYQKLMVSSSVLLIIFSFIHHSLWASAWSWVSLFTSAIVMQSNAVRQIALASLSAVFSVFTAPFSYLKKVSKVAFNGVPRRPSAILFVMPFLAIGLFGLLYAQANPDMDRAFKLITGQFRISIDQLFNNFFSPFFWMTVLGIIIGAVLLYGKFISAYHSTNAIEGENIRTKNEQKPDSAIIVRTFYKSALYTIGSLIVVLTAFLFLEIRDVWINFQWNGGELKYFVHQGTYVLIASILISASVVLAFFNNQLNFYPDSKLRRLSYVWLGLNGILALSVVIRTVHYIDNFGLAYLRIGVVFFIAACLFGLYSVYMKIKLKKSFLYLLRVNSISVVVLVVSIAAINWDRTITTYNFKHSESAFIHLRYLSEMSDKTLPLLVRNTEELERLKRTQDQLSHLDTRSAYYITTEDYQAVIADRVSVFKSKWEEKDFWEWNLPEYLAYQKLSTQ